MSTKSEKQKNVKKNLDNKKCVKTDKEKVKQENIKQEKEKSSKDGQKKSLSDKQKKKNNAKKLGKKGEEAAVNFLINKGYEIKKRNWKCSFGEADIIAVCDHVLTFVEVKTRSSLRAGMPEDSVNSKKRKKYECIAASYLQEHDYVDMPVRFDVIAILVISDKRALIRHHINAFGLG